RQLIIHRVNLGWRQQIGPSIFLWCLRLPFGPRWSMPGNLENHFFAYTSQPYAESQLFGTALDRVERPVFESQTSCFAIAAND
ncbi:hypothetical protein, partial [uncultured Tateyamaria sp.]|uniref:hypothetical protein n=1 Tax=uncultured Tateyamaria sp. TaxID=455651 RepID=UPI0026352B0F